MARSSLTDVAWEYMSAQILHVTTDLELIDRLAAGPRSSGQPAEETATTARPYCGCCGSSRRSAS